MSARIWCATRYPWAAVISRGWGQRDKPGTMQGLVRYGVQPDWFESGTAITTAAERREMLQASYPYRSRRPYAIAGNRAPALLPAATIAKPM